MKEQLIYREVTSISHKEAEEIFESRDSQNIAAALVGLAFYDSDWEYVKNLCINFLNDTNKQNQSIAAICLGHLARIHRNPLLREVIPLLRTFLNDSEIGGTVEDAIEEIEFFTDKKRRFSK